MTTNNVFPQEITTYNGLTLTRCEDFEQGRLSAGYPDSPGGLLVKGVIYEAESAFSQLVGEPVECCVCSDSCYPDDFEPVELMEDENGVTFYGFP